MCEEDHYTKDCSRRSKVNWILKGTPTILKEPFPSQQTQLVDQQHSSTSSSSQVFMMQGSSRISIATRTKDYQTSKKQMVKKEVTDIPSTSTLSSFGPLHIEHPNNEFVIRPPPKGVLQKSSYNLNARVAQHYNIVEDLAQAPLAMSALEVLQTCPTQHKSFLFAIGFIDPADLSLITFDLENHIPHLPHHIIFFIQVIIKGKMIHQVFINEGASTYIMYVLCWKAIDSPSLNHSSNTL